MYITIQHTIHPVPNIADSHHFDADLPELEPAFQINASQNDQDPSMSKLYSHKYLLYRRRKITREVRKVMVVVRGWGWR
jgi:hypothetical protein